MMRTAWRSVALSTSIALVSVGAVAAQAKGLPPGWHCGQNNCYEANGLLTPHDNPFISGVNNGSGNAPFSLWVYSRSNNEEMVYYGSTALNPYNNGSAIGFGSPTLKTIPNSWRVPDSPAPLIWEYHYMQTHTVQGYPPTAHPTFFGDLSWGNGQHYSTRLLDVMKQDHFSPSEIGGINPPGWAHFVAPKTPVHPLVPAPPGDPVRFPKNTPVKQWQWVRFLKRGMHYGNTTIPVNYPAKPHFGVLISGVFYGPGFQSLEAEWKSFVGPWIRFAPGSSRLDAIAPLQMIARHAPGIWNTWRYYVATPHFSVYSADAKAALTIQGVNPGTLGLQSYAPNVHSITPATARWLEAHHWGPTLLHYLVAHPTLQAHLHAAQVPHIPA